MFKLFALVFAAILTFACAAPKPGALLAAYSADYAVPLTYSAPVVTYNAPLAYSAPLSYSSQSVVSGYTAPLAYSYGQPATVLI